MHGRQPSAPLRETIYIALFNCPVWGRKELEKEGEEEEEEEEEEGAAVVLTAPAIEAAHQIAASPMRNMVIKVLITGLISPSTLCVRRTDLPSNAATMPNIMVPKAAMNWEA
eukprot:COSAG05_NODE_644_length_8127_cov_102.893373_3_plen_112_part_00